MFTCVFIGLWKLQREGLIVLCDNTNCWQTYANKRYGFARVLWFLIWANNYKTAFIFCLLLMATYKILARNFATSMTLKILNTIQRQRHVNLRDIIIRIKNYNKARTKDLF